MSPIIFGLEPSDFSKSPLRGFGGAVLGNLFAPLPDDIARATLDAAWDTGVRYYDTAPFYGSGLSERRFGEGLSTRPRDEFVLSTKVGRLLEPDQTVPGERESYVGGLPFRVVYDYTYDGARRSIEESLQRLGLSRVDVVYIHDIAEDAHGPDWPNVFATAMRGAARALSEMRAQGVIAAWGLGVNRVEPCTLALQEADPDLFLLAGRYTLLDTEALDSLFPECERRGVRVVVGGPYNSGLLAGGTTFEYRPAPPKMLAQVRRLAAICDRHGVDLKAAALQFCAAPAAVAAVIPGARTPDEAQQNAALMATPIPGELWHTLKRERLIPAHAPTPAHAETSRPAAASGPAARAGGDGPWGRYCHCRCELPGARVGAPPAPA